MNENCNCRACEIERWQIQNRANRESQPKVTDLKPFDIVKAMKGETVMTVKGDPVTGFHVFETSSGPRLVGVLRDVIRIFTVDDQKEVLRMGPVKKTYYQNIYRNTDGSVFSGKISGSREEAERLKAKSNALFIFTNTFEVEE